MKVFLYSFLCLYHDSVTLFQEIRVEQYRIIHSYLLLTVHLQIVLLTRMIFFEMISLRLPRAT
jgi:hypothetical protein